MPATPDLGVAPPARTPMVLHLNGPPGVGKSTLARRWALEHPGTLLLEIDELRTWVSGWRGTFESLGARVRPVALAMIQAYAETGHDVVVPQLVAGLDELKKFQAAAIAGGASYVTVFLEAEPDDLAARLTGRADSTPWLAVVRQLIEDAGPGHLEAYQHRLTELIAKVPHALRVTTHAGDVDRTYATLVEAVATPRFERPARGPGTG